MHYILFNFLLSAAALAMGFGLVLLMGESGWFFGLAIAFFVLWPVYLVRVLERSSGARLKEAFSKRSMARGSLWMAPTVILGWLILDNAPLLLVWLGVAMLGAQYGGSRITASWQVHDEPDTSGIGLNYEGLPARRTRGLDHDDVSH